MQELFFEPLALFAALDRPSADRPPELKPVETRTGTVPVKSGTSCLQCRRKPARVLKPGGCAVFCSATCRRTWTGNMERFTTRYIRDCDRADAAAGTRRTTLF